MKKIRSLLLSISVSLIMVSCSTGILSFTAPEPPTTAVVSETNAYMISLDASLSAVDLINVYAMNDWSYTGLDSFIDSHWDTFEVDTLNAQVGDRVKKGMCLPQLKNPLT